jgi:enterochelin esterase-like enzyme
MHLDEHLLHSASGEYVRKIWISRDEAERPRRLCVMLDAEYQFGKMEAPQTLSRLQEERVIPPLACVFVSQQDTESRHYDLTCNIRFSRFVAREVVEFVRQQDPWILNEPAVVCGMSLSGLAAAYLCLSYPDVFSHAVSHSGSFWWNGEWFSDTVRSRAPIGGKFWLSAGEKETATGLTHAPTGLRQEVSQIDAVKRAAAALGKAGAEVRYEEFSGGHDLSRWKDELPLALTWLIGSTSEAGANMAR